MKLEFIKKEWEKYMVIVDPFIIDMILGTLIGNSVIQSDPVWTMIISKSSGGKTTLIKPATLVPGVWFVDDMTEKTLLSGYKIKGRETSLLKVIGNGVLAFSDFTSILAKNPVSRGEILGQMKLIFDGEVVKRTGTGSVEWKGKIGFLGAATPDIYWHLESGRSMGERFLYYNLLQPSDHQIAEKQAIVNFSAVEIQNIMAPLYREYCQDVRDWVAKNGIPELKMTPEQRLKVKEASIFCINGKATTHTNFKSGKIDQMPNRAGVGRDSKMFLTLLQTFQLLDAYEHDDINYPLQDNRIELIEKCAYSSLNRERRKILEILADEIEPLSASQIGTKKGIGLEKDAIEMYLNPLYAIGLVKKQIKGNSFKWFINDKKVKNFINDVSKSMDNEVFKDDDEEEPLVSDVIEEALTEVQKRLAEF